MVKSCSYTSSPVVLLCSYLAIELRSREHNWAMFLCFFSHGWVVLTLTVESCFYFLAKRLISTLRQHNWVVLLFSVLRDWVVLSETFRVVLVYAYLATKQCFHKHVWVGIIYSYLVIVLRFLKHDWVMP